jgi:hypothetical protein
VFAYKSVVDALLEMYKLVVVAEVPVALAKVNIVSVDDALDTKPLPKTRVVEVESSLVPSLVNGKAKLIEKVGQALLQSPETQRLFVAKSDVVADVPVAVENKKLVRVEDAEDTNPLPKTRIVEVESSFVPSFTNGKSKPIEVK